MPKASKSKKEKKQDFQKPKLKVGKAKAKPANFTDTSFQSRCKTSMVTIIALKLIFLAISVLQQSLSTASRTPTAQFSHHLSLCNHKSASQRIESLAHLTTILEADRPPQPVSSFLPKVTPLLLDASPAARTQLMKLLRALPQQDVQQQAPQILLYVRAGMLSLATSIQLSALEAMEWLVVNAGLQLVSYGKGWLETLQTFSAMLRWDSVCSASLDQKDASGASGWSGSTSATLNKTPEGVKVVAKALRVLALFLATGLTQTHDLAAVQVEQARRYFPYTHFSQLMISQESDSSTCLRLMTEITDDNKSRYLDLGTRQKMFEEKHWQAFKKALENARKEGGTVGREASGCLQALKDCRSNYQVVNMQENLMDRLRGKGIRGLLRDAKGCMAEGSEHSLADKER